MHEETRNIELMYAISFVMPILLVMMLIWFIISYQKKKFLYENDKKDAILREQTLIIENQRSIESERNRIASEMHDDLGSGLTVMKFLSDKVLNNIKDETIKEDVLKISNYSTNLIGNMSEIIWAMNSRFDNIEGLLGYIRRYAVEYLEDNNIEPKCVSNENGLLQPISGEKRRNLFLIVKEILHNAVKYSGATKIVIEIVSEPNLSINILEEGGIGFDVMEKLKEGNGLYNITKRIQTIGGNLTFEKTKKGMQSIITLPLEKSTIVL